MTRTHTTAGYMLSTFYIKFPDSLTLERHPEINQLMKEGYGFRAGFGSILLKQRLSAAHQKPITPECACGTPSARLAYIGLLKEYDLAEKELDGLEAVLEWIPFIEDGEYLDR